MNVVIIEDERVVASELAESIVALEPEAVIVARLLSVKEAIAYFKSNEAPDLIFSDVQLGDGLSFEIFSSVSVSAPIVFCTAYDEYALDAFKVSGIDYILKPFNEKMLKSALSKYKSLQRTFSDDLHHQYQAVLCSLSQTGGQSAASILVYYQDKIVPLKLQEIALFYVKNEVTHLLTFSGKTYHPNKNLEELEKLAGESFFRANRQSLVSRKAIIDVSSFFSRKLSLNLSVAFEERITVSKEKAPLFLDWLTRVS